MGFNWIVFGQVAAAMIVGYLIGRVHGAERVKKYYEQIQDGKWK